MIKFLVPMFLIVTASLHASSSDDLLPSAKTSNTSEANDLELYCWVDKIMDDRYLAFKFENQVPPENLRDIVKQARRKALSNQFSEFLGYNVQQEIFSTDHPFLTNYEIETSYVEKPEKKITLVTVRKKNPVINKIEKPAQDEVDTSIYSLLKNRGVPDVDFSDAELVFNNLHAVHLSSVMIKNSTAIAGALVNGVALNTKMVMKDRCTLHHCLGCPVPEFIVGEVNYSRGVSLPIDKPDSYRYAYLDKLGSFRGDIAGGFLFDLFTVENHTYGRDAIVVVPSKENTEFHRLNPEFKGKVWLYEPGTQSLRDVVKTLLIIEKSWIIEYEKITAEGGHIINYGLSPLKEFTSQHQLIGEFFNGQGWYLGTHNHSKFRELENISRLFNEVFIKRSWKNALPAAYIPIFKELFLRKYEEIKKLNFNDKTIQYLEEWKEEALSFIRLHEFDSKLRAEMKCIFACLENVSDHFYWSLLCDARVKKDDLTKLVKYLTPLRPYQVLMIEDSGHEFDELLSDYIRK